MSRQDQTRRYEVDVINTARQEALNAAESKESIAKNSLSPGMSILQLAGKVADYSESVAKEAADTLSPVSFVSAASPQKNSEAPEWESFPPYFAEIGRYLAEIHTNIAQIDAALNRVAL